MMRRAGSGALAFVRSLALLVALVGGAPWALGAAARARFGAPAPLHGVPGPADWELDRVRSALTDRLTDDTIADLVVRSCLLVAWAAIVVVIATVAAESVHMARHGGLPLPEIRGLGPTQRFARIVAAGLLVALPVVGAPSRATGRDAPALVPELRSGIPASLALVADPLDGRIRDRHGSADDPVDDDEPAASPGPVPNAEPGWHVVRPGDSVYAIAQRLAGPDPADVDEYATRLIELNLGREMTDGSRFVNAAFIDVGWRLRLPDDGRDAADGAAGPTYVVERGESLWSIAEHELGDPGRWPEIFEANRGRRFGVGGTLRDPDLILPGWDLHLPDATASAADPVDPPVAPVAVDVADATAAGDDAPVAVEVADAAAAAADVPVVDRDRPASDDPGDAVPSPGLEPDDPGDAVPSPGREPDEPGDAVPSPGREPDDPGRHRSSDPPTAVGDATPMPGQSAGDDRRPRPVNVWPTDEVALSAQPSGGAPAGGSRGAGVEPSEDRPVDRPDVAERAPVRLLTLGRAAMLASGVLTLLAVRRRRLLRRASPRIPSPRPDPVAAAVERTLRAIDVGDRFDRVDVAVRAAATELVEAGTRVLAVLVAADGEIELRAAGEAALRPPWIADPAADRTRWLLPAATPIELLAPSARRVGPPCPLLVQLGRTVDDRDVYVDLEAVEALEIGGPGDQADAIVCALAASLASSVLAEVATLVGVGVPDEAFLGHRHHRSCRDVDIALAAAAEAIGSTATATRSTFELRSGPTSGEAWEPAAVLAGAAAGTVTPPRRRTGLAVVSASTVHGPSFRLAPSGDAWELLPVGLRLVPVGLTADDLDALAALLGSTAIGRADDPPQSDPWSPGVLSSDATSPDPLTPGSPDALSPDALSPDALSPVSPDALSPDALSPDSPDALSPDSPDALSRDLPSPDRRQRDRDRVDHRHVDRQHVDRRHDPDITIVEVGADPDVEHGHVPGLGPAGRDGPASTVRSAVHQVPGGSAPTPPLEWRLLVRLFGGVAVVSADGATAVFERSKTRELVAWLATHRSRATRSAARTALWELDVRDATFSNVVSEARRALARLVEPPPGDEWVGRTLTEALPLHDLVRTDADLIEHALAAARVQPPDQAIATLAPAVGHVLGMPFEGTSYLWPDAEGITSSLVVLATSATAELAAHHLSLGDVEGVFRATARGLQVLPGHETLIGLRMQAHARAGDLAGVRHEWESYERVIVADPWSDGEPAPQLVELRRELLHPRR